jgi:hypothetical protein
MRPGEQLTPLRRFTGFWTQPSAGWAQKQKNTTKHTEERSEHTEKIKYEKNSDFAVIPAKAGIQW